MDSNSPFIIFNMAMGFLWFGVAVFKVVVAVIALNKHKVPATTLMLIGGVLGIGGSLISTLMSLIGYFDFFEAVQMLIAALGLLSSLLFIVGTLQLVSYLGGRYARGVR